MHRHAAFLERLVNALIPYVLVALGIVLYISFTADTEPYEHFLKYFDMFVFAVFFLDLFFKWQHVRKASRFLRMYWLDILAIFPFYMIFRIYIEAADLFVIGKGIEETQKIAHEVILVQEEARILEEGKAIKEAKIMSREARPIARALRLLQRSLRFLRLRWFFFHKRMIHHSKDLKNNSKSH